MENILAAEQHKDIDQLFHELEHAEQAVRDAVDEQRKSSQSVKRKLMDMGWDHCLTVNKGMLKRHLKAKS